MNEYEAHVEDMTRKVERWRHRGAHRAADDRLIPLRAQRVLLWLAIILIGVPLALIITAGIMDGLASLMLPGYVRP